MSASVTGVPRERRSQALRWWLRDHKLPVFGWGLIVVAAVAGLLAWRLNVVDPSPVAQPPTSFGTEGANLVERGSFGPEIEVGAVGKDETRTYIIRQKGAKGPQPAVVFLHGFGSSIVVGYEPWLQHMAESGVTVIFPSWQQPPFPTDGSQNPRTNMFEGVRLAVQAVPVIESQVALVGVSAGAALAFDYAALSKNLDVPKTKLVVAIYPGRSFPGSKKAVLPLPPVGDMAPDTKVITMVSRKDEEAGTYWGVKQYDALAARPDLKAERELIYVKKRGLTSHYAPIETDAKARKQFWKPIDTALTEHLGASLQLDDGLRESIRAERKVKKNIENESIFRKEALELDQ